MGINFEHPWALLVLLVPLLWWGWECWRAGPASASVSASAASAASPARSAAAPARSGARPRTKPPGLLNWLRASRPGPFTWMRLILTLLLVLALAGTGVTYSAKHQAVMFIADISTSTATTRTQMEEFIHKAIGEMPAGDVAGVLAAGEDAQLETPVAARPIFTGFTAVVRPDHTDLERGLRLGAALLPSGYRPRLVLISDGKENVGNAMAEVQRLQQRGFTVDVVNLAPTPGAEALIKSMEAPGALRLGERLDVTVTLSATAATRATMRIYEEQTLLETRPVNLQSGDQQVRVTMEGLKAGYHRIWATLEAERDTLTQNNTAAVMVGIQGAPSVLVVEGFPGAGQNIRRALEATGMSVDVRTPDALPTHGTQFSRFTSVVMVDVPMPLMRADSVDAIASYVKQGGHGLVVIGGEHSYAMGGYAGTKLEEIMPVTMDVPQRKEKPPVAVALIIENFESDQKVNVSKEAGKALIDMLTPRDYVMVGDANIVGNWPVPPQRVTDKAKIKSLIDGMSPGDPPHYIDHIEAAAAELRLIDAKMKHIVLAGDGDAESATFGDYARRIGRIAADGITISTVHVNWSQPQEQVLMRMIANEGRGRYYLAMDPAATPQIFLKEAQTMARPGIVEEDFLPSVLSRSPVLQGVTELPPLRGYVATTPKPTGEVVLQSAQADPVLATWQAGLGKVVAYTSDSGGLWSGDMVQWSGFSQFWSNVVSWTMPAVDSAGIRTTTTVVGGKAQLTVQLPGDGLAVGSQGGAKSWPASITAGIIQPDGTTKVMQLRGTAPGQYEGEIPASQPGPYLVKLSAGTSKQSVLLGETFVVAPYSPEFGSSGADPGYMQRLARAGGGKELTDPKTAFARDLPPAPGRLPLDHALLLAALLLWPLDIAMRRLSVTPAEVREAVRKRRERRALAGGMATAAGSALSKLRERRAEVPLAMGMGAGQPAPAPGKVAPAAAPGKAAPTPVPGKAPPTPAPGKPAPTTPDPAPSTDAATAPKPSGPGSPFTQRLLDARRKRKD